MASLLENLPRDHRPWPVPGRAWALSMVWRDLLFLHWPVPANALTPTLPTDLTLDTFEGKAWLGVVPFRMERVGPRGLTWLPGISRFAELNVRTYVTCAGKPGVWFYSLDAASVLAVRAARRLFHLPYFDARMEVESEGDRVLYSSTRTHHGAQEGCFTARYGPTGPVFRSVRGSIEEWLTERYCLYAADPGGRLHRGEIHHAPWPLQPATCEIETNTLAAPLGLGLDPAPPLVHFAKELEVVAWMLERC
jgi:hypothetical protein